MCIKTLSLSVVLIFSLTTCAQKEGTELHTENLVALAKEYLDINPQASGVMAAMDYPGKLNWNYAIGHVGLGSDEVLQGNELFVAASITKTFVAVCILQMEEEGKLSLQDKASKYLDRSMLQQLTMYRGRSYEEELSLEHLLRHTSGISDYLNNTKTHLSAYRNHPDKIYTLPDRMAIALEVPSTKKFGKYHYSNTNYVLLGMVAETIDKLSIAEILDKRIIQPLGLVNTSLKAPKTVLPKMLKGYYTDWDLTSFSYHFNQSNPAGGILTNVNDLLVFGQHVFRGKLFQNKATLEKMLDFENGYGLGVMQYDKSRKTGRIFGHSGFDPGYTCYLAYLENLDATVVTVINQSELEAVMPAFLLVKMVRLVKEDR